MARPDRYPSAIAIHSTLRRASEFIASGSENLDVPYVEKFRSEDCREQWSNVSAMILYNDKS